MISRPVALGSRVPQWPTFLMPNRGGWRPPRRGRSGRPVCQRGWRRRGRRILAWDCRENYLAACSARLTAAMTRRWTDKGVPGMRAPAAAGCPPPPNWPADFADVDLGAFGTQAQTRQLRLEFLEHAGHHHRLNRADMVNQALPCRRSRRRCGRSPFASARTTRCGCPPSAGRCCKRA